MDFIKTEVSFVNYVMDRSTAEIYILITTQETGSGGTEYTMIFTGQYDYDGMNDTLKYISGKFDTEDIIRRGIVQRLKAGLMRYVADTPLVDNLIISMEIWPSFTTTSDKWHNWLFNLNMRTNINGQQSRNSYSVSTTVSANRITEDWKIRNNMYYNYDKNIFRLSDNKTIVSVSKSYGLSGLVVNSIDDHWSTGGGLSFFSSTYSNEKIRLAPWYALEYSIFPYRESTSRELRVFYQIGYVYFQYLEETIYEKTRENLFFQSISITLDAIQRWGSASTTLYGFHYLHDPTKHKVTLSSNLFLSLIARLSFTLSGSVSLVHNQISLPKRDLTEEEILLQIKQLSTQYSYSLSAGFTYSFGSLYSNVVNPRFGN